MAVAGYRATEDGNTRILQNGDTRVTENFYTVDCSLSAGGSISFLGKLKPTGATTLVGSSTLVTSGDLTKYAAILVANNSTLVALGNRKTAGEISLSTSGSITTNVTLNAVGLFAGSGSGTISAATRVVKYVEVVSGQATFTRITENEDYRITESGDSRITNVVPTNEIIGSIVALDTYIPFSSVVYYKTGGVWKTTLVNTQYNGNWNALTAIYKKISGNWKRIH